MPLHNAAYHGNDTVVRMLLNAGADRNMPNWRGRTALHMACLGHRSKIVRDLLLAGASPSVQDNDQLKPLHLCLPRDEPHIGKIALQTLQELVHVGETWDMRCDQLVMGMAPKEVLALQTCILMWTQQRKLGHPLTPVEPEFVRRGPAAVEALFKELEKSTETHHRRKICVVGPSNAGKTSFIKSIQTTATSLQHADDRTIGIDQFPLRFTVNADGDDITHEVTFWDFAGHDEYQVAHSLFYSRRTLYLVCVDLESFLLAYIQADITNDSDTRRERMLNEFIERKVLAWVRTIIAHQPDAEFVFVATKEDLLVYPQFAKELKSFLALKLAEIDGIVCEMKREIYGQLPVVPNQRKADMLTFHAYKMRQIDNKTRVHDEKCNTLGKPGPEIDSSPVVVSLPNAKVDTCVAKARSEPRSKRARLKHVWRKTCERVSFIISGRPSVETRPESRESVSVVMTRTPTLYISCSGVKSVVKARRRIESLIHFSDRSFLMPQSYSSVLDLVVSTRESVAKQHASKRIPTVFAAVDSILGSLSTRLGLDREALRLVLQILHDLGDVLWYEDLDVGLFHRTVILDPMLLIDFVRQVITHVHKVDVLSHVEVKRLPFWRDLHDNEQILAMKQMLQKFQLVHPSQGEMEWDSDLIVPAFWRAKTPASWQFKYTDLRLVSDLPANDPRSPKERVRVHWQYMFAHEFPDTLFDHLVVASYKAGKKRTAGPDWILYTEDRVCACRVMVARDVSTKERLVQLEAVLAEDASETLTSMLWETFEIVSKAVVQVFRRYPGIVFTSIASDTDGKTFRLGDLISSRRTIEMDRWLPPQATWESYRECVFEASET